MLFASVSPKAGKACQTWQRRLKIDLSEENWECSAHKGSLNVTTQENNYKNLIHWYRTPELLNKFNPDMSDKCWRCSRETGTLLHIWWSCLLLQTFWIQVHEITSQVTTYSLDYTPAQFILHHSSTSAHSYWKSLVVHMISAAKLCIPVHWGSSCAPIVPEWLTRLGNIAEMEELIHIAWDSPSKFSWTWACWSHFCSTERYASLMGLNHTEPPQ